jgi:hypothetical protein
MTRAHRALVFLGGALWWSAATRANAAVGVPAPIDLPETPAQLVLDERWLPGPVPQMSAAVEQTGPARLVAVYRDSARDSARDSGAGGLVLSVMRFDAPNPAAWRRTTRTAYLDEIEAGLAAACPSPSPSSTALSTVNDAPTTCRGYRRSKRTIFESEGVPTMDLQAANHARATLLFRFLFFRTYTILAVVEVAPGSSSAILRRARRALNTFTPAPNWQR